MNLKIWVNGHGWVCGEVRKGIWIKELMYTQKKDEAIVYSDFKKRDKLLLDDVRYYLEWDLCANYDEHYEGALVG